MVRIAFVGYISKFQCLVRDGVRRHLAAMGEPDPPAALADRELIERHVARAIVKPQALEVCTCEAVAQKTPSLFDSSSCRPPTPTIALPWTAPSFQAV
jgi:hypothetical protein